ncbi:MAG TPA: tetratricopeptide repeat protein [Candidatus Eisenbacteria bacterium]|jgi:tetratricopeptide (TPR) repeat protein
MIGSQISHYRILSRLGSGSMGEVFRAEDVRLGRHVALKFLHPDLLRAPEARQRFVFEARAVAILNHPNITTLYEFDPDRGFMSLEFVEGSNLEERLTQGALTPRDAVRVALAICRGLGHAHGRSVVHRDIKPSNILLGTDGATKLTDFGIAKRHDASMRTATGAVMGTAPYMCPEQVRGQRMDRRGDLFSLGVVLYRTLSGRLPWSGEGLATFYAVLHETPPPLLPMCPGTPPELAALVERLLQKEPGDRFASAEEVEKYLLEVEDVVGGAPLRAVSGQPVRTEPKVGGVAPPAPIGRTEPAGTGMETAVAPGLPARFPFVGRHKEFGVLEEGLARARLGAGRAVLLEGEAGLGKSRLMEEFRNYAEAQGVLCLKGRCAFHGGRNFEPFVEALEEFARRARPEETEAGAGASRAHALPGALFSTLNMLLDPEPRIEAKSREQLWYLLDSVLKRIAQQEPLVLFLDDLHWADEGTLSLFNHVTRNLAGARLLLVASYRPEELRAASGQHPLEDLIRLLSTVETFHRVSLEPLGPTETAALLDAALDGSGSGQVVAATIHKRAQGNPFFTIEIIRLLSGPAGRGAGGPVALETIALPPTVTDVVARRLTRLSSEERDVLDLAAVEGESFHTGMLEEGTGLSRIVLLKRLRALHQVHHLILPTEEGHRFTHGLVREVLLREMPAELRREYHRVVADHLVRGYQDRPDYAGPIGYHLFEAQRFADSVPFLVGAAREARRLFLNDRALGFCERALEARSQAAGAGVGRAEILRLQCEILLLLGRPDAGRAAAEGAWAEELAREDEPGKAAAEEQLGEAALAQGDLHAAERFLSEARGRYTKLGDAGALARCDRKLGALAVRRGDYDEALRRLEAALASAEVGGDEPEAARIRVEAGEVHFKRGAFDRALETFEAATEDLRRLGDRHGLTTGLMRRGNVLFHSGRPDPALPCYEEALAVAVEVGDLQSMAKIQANLGNIHLVRGDSDGALACYQSALRRFEEIGDQSGAGQMVVALGNVCFSRAQFEEAARYYSQSLGPREAVGDRWGLANSLDNLGSAEFWLGRWSPALEHARTALRHRTALGDRAGCAESAMNLGALMAVLGDLEEAERQYAEAARVADELGDPRRKARAFLAQACLKLWSGAHGRVADLLATIRSLEVEEAEISARRLLLEGLIGGAAPDAGASLLHRAFEEAVRSGSILEQTEVRLALARMHIEAGRQAEAEAELGRALEVVGEGRVPLLELRVLGLQKAIVENTGGEPNPGEIEGRICSLAGQLVAALPAKGAPRRDFGDPPFPLP